jgi:hypothetical protein
MAPRRGHFLACTNHATIGYATRAGRRQSIIVGDDGFIEGVDAPHRSVPCANLAIGGRFGQSRRFEPLG